MRPRRRTAEWARAYAETVVPAAAFALAYTETVVLSARRAAESGSWAGR
jgi:hypothetical protein